jgi:GNAT superfamily N-acetyltransferase
VTKTTLREYVTQLWGWDEQWQRAHFQERFDPNQDEVIVLTGRDIGVISVEQKEDELFLSKIYILPDYQGRGIGTYLIQSVLNRATDSGLPVALQVLTVNPVKRLYEHLGFVEVEKTSTHILMRKMPT